MTSRLKKTFTLLIAALFIIGMSTAMLVVGQPGDALAEGESQAASSDAGGDASSDDAAAADCHATIKYYDLVDADTPGVVPDETGRWLLGTREIDGLHEGDVLHAWDYVVNIPGYFFFDGWPRYLTITTNPADNVIELNYFNRNNASFTVNYYLMQNADLTADNWASALAPDDVEFIKLGSETFDNQRFNALIEGDAYEYRIDGTYVVDTYPAEIRLTEDPDDNVLNVLYVPESTHLPDNVEIPDLDESAPPDASGPSQAPSLPGDTEFDQDGIVGVLPDGTQASDELYQDLVGSSDGLTHTSGLSQTGDDAAPWIIGTLVAAAAVMGALALLARWRTQRHDR